MMKWIALCVALAVTPAIADTRGLTAQDMVELRRISTPTPAPDGTKVLYVLRETNLAASKVSTDIWLLDLKLKAAMPVRLTQDLANDSDPVWSKDGQRIYFLSNRSGSSQIWSMAADGSQLQQLSKYPVDVGGFHLSPDETRFAFWAAMLAACDTLKCTADGLATRKADKASGRVYDMLPVRFWDSWGDATRWQLFTAKSDALQSPILLTKPLDGDVPHRPFGTGTEIAFSPDSLTLYFSMRASSTSAAWSNNADIFAVPSDGSAAPRNLTLALKGSDTVPVPSPDGSKLAWLSMPRAGVVSDKQRLMLMDLASGQMRDITKGWDRSITAFKFAKDGASVFAIAQHMGSTPLWQIDVASGKPQQRVEAGTVDDFAFTNKDILYIRHDLTRPADMYRITQKGGKPRQLTHVNTDKLVSIAMSKPQQISFTGWNKETVYAWVLPPLKYDRTKKYPVAFLVHGGPQTSFGDQFHYRWNAQAFTARGYGVVMIDFHGSTGYGQAFTDSISQDWGGKPLVDLKLGWAAALKQFSWMNEDKACALGGSYGGYMMAWIASQWADEFQCLVNHAGVVDKRALAYTIDEPTFTNWENGGMPFVPAVAEQMAKDDPIRFVDQWRTPTLVIHGEKDYRVPDTQGLSVFTALQLKGVASRLLVFPDENHWILKPDNSIQWHDEVLGWLDKWLKPLP